MGRVEASVATVRDFISASATATDSNGVLDASKGLLDWASSERGWITAHPPAPCFEEAHGRYGAAVGELSRSASELVVFANLGTQDEEALNASAANILASADALDQVLLLAGASLCGAAQASTAPETAAPPTGYLTLANEVLRLRDGADTDHPMDADPRGHATAMAAVYQRALDGLNALSVPSAVESDLGRLRTATAAVIGLLTLAADATTEEKVRYGEMALAFGPIPEMQAAADDVRRGLGLPPRAEGDPL